MIGIPTPAARPTPPTPASTTTPEVHTVLTTKVFPRQADVTTVGDRAAAA